MKKTIFEQYLIFQFFCIWFCLVFTLWQQLYYMSSVSDVNILFTYLLIIEVSSNWTTKLTLCLPWFHLRIFVSHILNVVSQLFHSDNKSILRETLNTCQHLSSSVFSQLWKEAKTWLAVKGHVSGFLHSRPKVFVSALFSFIMCCSIYISNSFVVSVSSPSAADLSWPV